MSEELARQQDRIRDMARSLADALEYLTATERRTTDAVSRLQTAAVQLKGASDTFSKHSTSIVADVNRRLQDMPERVGEKVSVLVSEDVKTVVAAAVSELHDAAKIASRAAVALQRDLRANYVRLAVYAAIGGSVAGAVVAGILAMVMSAWRSA